MSAFKLNRRTRNTERKNMDKTALLKYRNELVAKGFLEIEQQHNEIGEFESNLYTLLDGPRKRKSLPSADYPPTVGPPTVGPSTVNPPTKSTQSLRRPAALPTEEKENPKSKDRPGEAGTDSSSSFSRYVSVPAQIPDRFKDSNGTIRSPGPADPVEDQVKFFLNRWRTYQSRMAISTPRFTRKESEALTQWIEDCQPVSLMSYLAMAVRAWTVNGKREENGFINCLCCWKHSRKLLSFLNNVESIEQELGWNHNDMDRIKHELELVAQS